jgi:hypothetical protein
MLPKPPDQVEELWNQAQSLSDDLGTALAEINEMWAEISSRFSDPLYAPDIPAKVRAEYLLDSTQHLQFVQRATALLQVRKEINERNRQMELPSKLEALTNAAKNSDADYASKLFDPEAAAAFLALKGTIDGYPKNLKESQASALIAVYAPIFFLRDAFAAYLDRPRPGAETFGLLLTLTKDAALEFLGKSIPLLSQIKAIAEAAHKHAEGGYEKFSEGLKQQVLLSRLQTSVEEGMAALTQTEQFIAQWRVSEDQLNHDFNHAVDRVTGVLKMTAKNRG